MTLEQRIHPTFCATYLAARFCSDTALRYFEQHVETGAAAQTATPIGRETAIAKSPKGDAAAPLSALQDGYAGYDHDFFGQGPA